MKWLTAALFFAWHCQAAEHPRLYLTPARIAQLRVEIKGERKAHWETLRKQADGWAARHPPAPMAWVLSGDRTYLKAAEEWSLASCGYLTWGYDRFLNNDLPAGPQLFGLAMVYDWLYQDLTPGARETIRQTLLRHGHDVYRAADPQRGTYWKDEYRQNHLVGDHGGTGGGCPGDSGGTGDCPGEKTGAAVPSAWTIQCAD